MHRTCLILRPTCLWLVLACLLAAPATSSADERFETLKIGRETYTNVLVLNKTPTDLFIQHSHGMANFKVKDLDPALRDYLGYQLAESSAGSKMSKVFDSPAMAELEADPRVKEMEALLAAQLSEFVDRIDARMAYSIAALVILSYLLFSFLCRCICVKTSNPPSALIWLPLLKQIPLFKAADMSPWWILSNIFPPMFFIAYIIWCFKIVAARGKNVIFGVFLLLPLTNLLAFLYLALSSAGGEEEETGNPNVISLQGGREAA